MLIIMLNLVIERKETLRDRFKKCKMWDDIAEYERKRIFFIRQYFG